MKKNKKTPVPLKILKAIFSILIAILLVIILWFCFCLVDKKQSYTAIPSEYSLYVRTDSIWDGVNPLLDLQAAEILLADENLSSIRASFLQFRNSKLRENKFIQLVCKRRLDAALYEDNSFVAVLDAGFLSFVTRLAPLASYFINIENLTFSTESDIKYFEYTTEQLSVYVAVKKNLIIAASNKALFETAAGLDNAKDYSDKTLQMMKTKLLEPFIIAADGKKLINTFAQSSEQENIYFKLLSDSLSDDELSTIKFGITDKDIELKGTFPLTESQELHPVTKILQKDSVIPSLLSKLPGNVQYYTFINAGSLEELKNAAFTVVPPDVNINSIWNTAETACKMIFNLTIEELLFSWTDNEFAVCGLESKAEPIFVIKIADETQRQNIFSNILSSAILKSDDSLLIDGIRLPRIEMPLFLQNLLNTFGINIPKPYFIVKDNYIFFSQSPENLISVNSVKKSSTKLINTKNWTQVSSKQNPISTISLFYNLERSLPFFLKNKSTFTDILKLYNIGRFDIFTKDNKLTMQLQATAVKNVNSKLIPGFPIAFENRAISPLYCSKNQNVKQIYFAESNKIHAISTNSLEDKTLILENVSYISPANPETGKSSKGELWAITDYGALYLLDEDLKVVDGFPITIESAVKSIVPYKDSIIIPQSDASAIQIVKPNGQIEYLDSKCNKTYSVPVVYKDIISIYDRGFLGKINAYSKKGISSFDVNGIGYGSPAIFTENHELKIAFITQAGNLYSAKYGLNGFETPELPLPLENVFYLGLHPVKYKNNNNVLVALSQDGTLYRIENRNITKTRIPYLKVKSGTITAADYDDDGDEEVFICGEGNTIYGFRANLDMIEGFPISGYGNPVFVDVNGDNKKDCLTLSLDNKIYAYKLEY